jgi:FAD/FMN-containing dehydrogenase
VTTRVDWSSLRRAVAGRLRMPADPGYDDVSRPYNHRYTGVRPAAVLSVAGPADVGRAIGWARDHDLPVVARGGGHGYADHAVTPELLIDLGGLGGVRVDPSTGLVTVGGGVRMGALAEALRRHDLAFPLGNSKDVGIGGLVLGGGVAAVSRQAGLTCDWLVETDVVLADGTTVTCDAARHADLFWACRGGGGGNFGLNTSFTFQAAPVAGGSTCLLLWPWEHARAVLTRMQDVMHDAPDGFAARIGASRAPARASSVDGVVSVVGQHAGPASELRELLAPALALARPDRCEIEDRTYWEAMEYLHRPSVGYPFGARNRLTAKPLPEAAVAAMVSALERWPGGGHPEGAGVALFTWGGAINRVPSAATAFPHRDTLFLVSMTTSWSPDDPPALVSRNLAWLSSLHAELGEFASDAAYVNFADPDLADHRGAYYGPNLGRLTEVKRRYDPDRVFRFPQAI